MTPPSDPLTQARPTSGNGHDPGRPHLDRPVPAVGRRPPGPSTRPAAIAFGIILLIFVSGFVADDLTSAHHPPPAPHARALKAVPGTGGLVPEPSTDVIGPIVESDEPPANVLAALVVPGGTRTVPGSGTQSGLGLYDATIEVVVPAAQEAVITFTRAELAAGSWQTVSAGSDGTGYRFIAQHPGSDGYEWEVGVTLSSTTFHSPVTGMSVPASGVTPVTLRLFAISDES